MNNLSLVLGGPGCGKTTRLLEIVEREMAQGVEPGAIAFVTFNKDAARHAKGRAADKFGLDAEKDLPWFRTIHSLAYAGLGVSRDEMMTGRDWNEFGGVVGEVLTGSYSTEDGVPGFGREIGDILLRITEYANTTLLTLEAAWQLLDEPVPWHRLKRFAAALREYKHDTGKMDFTDLLMQYPRAGKPLNVRVAIIDEGQDLTAAQWAVVRHAFSGVERTYVAGDDDQAIYFWAGADVPQFLDLSRGPEVLPLSHRLPRQVHALSQQIAARISRRYTKIFSPGPRTGDITWHQHPQGIEFTPGTWFLLARNNYMLRGMEQMVRDAGLNYTKKGGPAVNPGDVAMMQLWERLRAGKLPDCSARDARNLAKALGLPKPQTKESQRYTIELLGVHDRGQQPWYDALTGIAAEKRDYYRAAMRRGEKLTVPPRVRLDTIHGVKGAEADHVVLMTDMSGRTAKSYHLNADNEHRVFYVGVTRAKQSLHLIMPQSDQAYPIPS